MKYFLKYWALICNSNSKYGIRKKLISLTGREPGTQEMLKSTKKWKIRENYKEQEILPGIFVGWQKQKMITGTINAGMGVWTGHMKTLIDNSFDLCAYKYEREFFKSQQFTWLWKAV